MRPHLAPHLVFRRLAVLAVAGVLGACAGYSTPAFAPGTPVGTVTQSMGTPTGRYPLPGGGERLEFARGPMGLHTFMVDVDPQGRAVSSDQVMRPERFQEIAPAMSRQQVLAILGRPAYVFGIGWQRRTVWNYRFDNPACSWFQVSFDTAWNVVETGYGPDPRCDAPNDPRD